MNMEASLSVAQATLNPPSITSGSNIVSGNVASGQSQAQIPWKDYKWFNAYSLPLELQCGILRLEFPEITRLGPDLLPEDLSVTVQIYCNQLAIFDPPLSTLFSQTNENLNLVSWDHILTFPVKVKDLSLDAILVCTIWTSDQEIFGGTTMRLFDDYGCLKQGKQKLLLFQNTPADPTVVYSVNQTPGEYYHYFQDSDYYFQIEKMYELFVKKNSVFPTRDNTRKDWLDILFLKKMQQIQSERPYFHRELFLQEDLALQEEMLLKYFDQMMTQTTTTSDELELQYYSFLVIEMPTLNYPVFYEDKQYPTVDPHNPPNNLSLYVETLKECIVDTDEYTMEFQLTGKHFNPSWLTFVADWDMNQENLSEEQNRRLSHNVRKGAADSTVKPNKEEKARIDKIIQTVGNQMNSSDMDFLYRFRYSLTENKKALVKFLYALNWDEENEVNELPVLLALWRERSPIDVADALKLLSKDKSFEHPYVREYAVETLRSASDEELLTFLLQLVQALRYEPATTTATTSATTTSSNASSVPAVAKAMNDLSIQSKAPLAEAMVVPQTPSTPTSPTPPRPGSPDGVSKVSRFDSLSPLANFLIERACRSPVVANFLFWYLKVEVEDDSNDGTADLYGMINASFYNHLANYNEDTRLWLRRLRTVDDYYNLILTYQSTAIKEGKRRDGKELAFKQALEKNRLQILPDNFDWVPMPLDPRIRISGLKINTVNMFASAVYPAVIEFEDYDNKLKIQQFQREQQHLQSQVLPGDITNPSSAVVTVKGGASTSTTVSSTTTSAAAIKHDVKSATIIPPPPIPEITHKIIFKSGDDLRQDQLIMQMISLMDSLLKKVNLDMKLVTYGILAVTKKDGLMEFVRNSMPISAVLNTHGTILNYLRLYNADKSGPFEISPVALDTYIKSCAGSCVITYILGIGDRHLDNIMLTRSGQLFHIDFGFIFGQDPKPFPPPFRFTKSMADAMGGEDSEYYARFKTFCCQCYNWLRKSANLILNLLSLMGDAGINDISKRSDLTKVLLKVEEKFRLDLTDEQAEQYFLGLISESLHSLAPKLMEVAHKIAVSLR